MSVEPACNIYNPIQRIKHGSLERFGDSAYKSVCPQCKEGILFVYRDPETFKLLRIDCCCLCGQRFEYTDLEEIFPHEV